MESTTQATAIKNTSAAAIASGISIVQGRRGTYLVARNDHAMQEMLNYIDAHADEIVSAS